MIDFFSYLLGTLVTMGLIYLLLSWFYWRYYQAPKFVSINELKGSVKEK